MWVRSQTMFEDPLLENYPIEMGGELTIYGYCTDTAFHLGIQAMSPLLAEQIAISGLSIYLSSNGKKKKNNGIIYPPGLALEDRPRDPERLQAVLFRLDQAPMIGQSYVWISEGQPRMGSLPGPVGLELITHRLSSVWTYEYVLPHRMTGISPDQPIRIGWETGTLGRPELSSGDGVGIYGVNASNPNQLETQQQRQRMRDLERYREFTVAKKGWAKKLQLPKL